MAQMQLFILFPEYVERENTATAPYIKTIDMSDLNVTQKYITDFGHIVSFFSYEDYDGYYDLKNLEAFIKSLKKMENCYPDPKTILKNTIKNWRNWRDEAIGDNGQSYYFYTMPLIDDTLTEIARRKYQTKDTVFLVVNNEGIDHKEKLLPVYNHHRTDQEIQQCNCDSKSLHKWFEENRLPKRVFNLNPKHGENGKGKYKKKDVSSLYSSHDEAEILLHKAIDEDSAKRLYFYDKKYKKYIEFRNENTPQNTYHAFHIEQNEIAEEVKRKIDELNT
ncbi:hypothetical protein EZS27_004964 [termite gut metagenome]|uniref:Uncharacterized protein n=1 Tax=termite gut metagenome TaxID=433724 RepID=A0A5J4SQN5_9ZZZZ